jgi:aldose sugar dehydrogenase
MSIHRLHPIRRRLRWAALASAVGATLWLVSACGGSSGDAASVGSVENGARLFAASGANCIQCHVDPRSMRRAADEAGLAALIAGAIRDNKGTMGSPSLNLAALTPQDHLDIAAYLVSLGGPVSAPPTTSPPPATAPNPPSASIALRTTNFATGLTGPWGMAWLPDGQLLVTQKRGDIVRLAANGSSRVTLAWSSPRPDIRDGGQGGLLGIAVDPDYASGSPWIYFAYQEPGANGTSGTAIGRAQISGNDLVSFQRLAQQTPKVGQDGVHFGSRLAFMADKTLLVSFGDRGQDNPSSPNRDHAQNLSKSLGKILRINRDGSIPAGNPVVPAGSVPGLWSWGHRNPQGLTVDAATGAVWETEHGPQGGDELNRISSGSNYGWPLRSYGCPYGSTPGPGCQVGGGTHAPLNGVNFVEPVTTWVPTSTAPSNLVVYRGTRFPEWNGHVLVGALSGERVWRVVPDTNPVVRESLLQGIGRVRDISVGPDGWIYLANDDGRIVRVFR